MNFITNSSATAPFQFAVAYLDHNHIYGQTTGLVEAGATVTRVFDPNPAKILAFINKYPNAVVARSFEEILDDPNIHLVVSAAIPDKRAQIGKKVMLSGKDYFTDKAPFTTRKQLATIQKTVAMTKCKYLVYYSERLHNWPTYHAGELIRSGAIGKVLQVLILAPHNLDKKNRPKWFFKKKRYGGILTDLGSHQFEQMLYFTNAQSATINHCRVANFANPDTPELEDFGEALITLDSGASGYCRVDWFNPESSKTWGDGRAFVLGTTGYIEIRKNIDLCNGNHYPRIILVNDSEERTTLFKENKNLPFFKKLISDCVNRTETAITQKHIYATANLTLKAQELADQPPLL